jgi:hypothetical protein
VGECGYWPNLVCTLPGQTGSLPSLIESLGQQPRRQAFLFVGFAVIGSRTLVTRMSCADVKKIAAMVNNNSLGAGVTRVALSRGHQKLIGGLWLVAQTTSCCTHAGKRWRQ